MASNVGSLATQAPVSAPPAPSPPPDPIVAADGIARLSKRLRESESVSPRSHAVSHFHTLASPAKAARLGLATSQPSPLPLTGAAALKDERRRRQQEGLPSPAPMSPNPSRRVVESLLSGAAQPMSRPADLPQMAPMANMDPAIKTLPSLITTPSAAASRPEDREAVSPQSTNGTAGATVARSPTPTPTPMDVDGNKPSAATRQESEHNERPATSSLSYPDSLQNTASMAEQTSRGLSYPIGAQVHGSPSSAGKKHKCPYCSTEFTRHHNLKSHLLTHSHEKPYVCTDCQMRFRRLHDLKRHGKLHTGEKPHVCPKCNRKFARGDALARHSKGSGGCAGRRSSMGSFLDGEELDGSAAEGNDSNMSGLAYEHGDEEELRMQSLPSMGSQPASGESCLIHARTYPPAGLRPTTNSLHPPPIGASQGGAINGPPSGRTSLIKTYPSSMRISPPPPGTGSSNLYSQAGMTESPKPLSPGLASREPATIGRPRSPPPSQAYQPQADRPGLRRQSPPGSHARPRLPGISQQGFAPPGSAAYSHDRTPSGTHHGSDSGNMFAQSDPSLWVYIQTVEASVKSLTDTVSSLTHEIAGLKKQLAIRDGSMAA